MRDTFNSYIIILSLPLNVLSIGNLAWVIYSEGNLMNLKYKTVNFRHMSIICDKGNTLENTVHTLILFFECVFYVFDSVKLVCFHNLSFISHVTVYQICVFISSW